MCLIKTKRYTLPNGDRQTIEDIRYCSRTIEGTLCDDPRYTSEEATVVVRKPSTRERDRGVIVTQGRDGREHVSRRLSRSGKKPAREPASPTSLAGASIREVKPRAPTPPSTGAQYPPSPPVRCPRPDCPLKDSHGHSRSSTIDTEIVTPRRGSFSSVSAEPGDIVEVGEAGPSTRNKKRVSITIPYNKQSSVPSPRQKSTKHGDNRQDSAKGFPSARNPDRRESYRVENRSPREDEEARQAALERARYESREQQRAQKQASAEKARADAERNAREAEADRERDRRIDAELKSAEQERLQADQQAMHQDWEHRRSYEQVRPLRQSPASPRHQLTRPTIHQEGTRPREDPLRSRGSDVIAREQARLAREELQSPHIRALEVAPDDEFAAEIEVAERNARHERNRRYREEPRKHPERERRFWK